MKKFVVMGAYGGIGTALTELLRAEGHWVIPVGRHNDALIPLGRHHEALIPREADGIVCCNGSFIDPMLDCYVKTKWAFDHCAAPINIALAGGGVGGPLKDLTIPVDYVASKAALCALVEVYSYKEPARQYFAVSPGRTSTQLIGFKDGADPKVPAAFIARLLSGAYAHLSGGMIAAQRDDLDTMHPMMLRRIV